MRGSNDQSWWQTTNAAAQTTIAGGEATNATAQTTIAGGEATNAWFKRP